MTLPTHNGSRRILLVLYGTLFVLCGTFIGVAHWYELKSQRKEAMDRLSAVAASLADQIPARHPSLLLEKYTAPGVIIKPTQDARYYVVHEQLRKAAQRSGLDQPLLLATKDEQGQLVIVVTSEEQPRFREAIEDGQEILPHYSSGTRMDDGRAQLMAVEPLRELGNSHSEGVIIARMPRNEATASAYAALWRNIGIALALFVLAGIFLFRSVGRWVQQTEADKLALASRNLDITDSITLNLLNTRVVTTLHQQGQKRGAGDGMDIALCRIDRKQREILFAGAFRPLYWLHDGQLSIINGDRKPVGGAHLDLDRKYTSHRLAYSAGDRIYLFSDGYVGPTRRARSTSAS
ncbi:MAG: hypothetical protein IPJ85_05375 [Flavobacteriales bacterium]|nr:hypothetical protein [Flavobacteriales bacterium]